MIGSPAETERVPVRAPVALGLNVTLTGHEDPTGMLVQVEATVKSPETVSGGTETGPGAMLVRVTGSVADAPTSTLPKLRVVVDTVTARAPVPVRVAVMLLALD